VAALYMVFLIGYRVVAPPFIVIDFGITHMTFPRMPGMMNIRPLTLSDLLRIL